MGGQHQARLENARCSGVFEECMSVGGGGGGGYMNDQ